MSSEHKMYAVIWFAVAVVAIVALTYFYLGAQNHGENSAPIVNGDIACTYNHMQWHCTRIA